jgi:hypothetical protein
MPNYQRGDVSPPTAAQLESTSVENELRCTICGLSACWTK